MCALLGMAAGACKADAPAPAPPSPAEPAVAPIPTAAPKATYDESLAAIAGGREGLSAEWNAAGDDTTRAGIIERARHAAHSAIVEQAIPHWFGTPWSYRGTSETPGKGVIGCGYFVATVLRDVGFPVERETLAQQPAEWIIKTFAGEDQIWRYRSRPTEVVLGQVRFHGDGLYLVGFDEHVGFLIVAGADVSFCHASYTGDAVVVCEPAKDSFAFQQDYRVVGRLLGDRMMEAWLAQTPMRTYPYGEMGI